MNWSRIRWLLMVCLLLTDCFLGILLYRQYRGEHLVSRAALEDAVQLLDQSGISLDMDIVPTEVIKDYVYGIPVAEESYKHAFAQMVGSPVSGIYLLPTSTGMSLVFENGDRAEYYHNLYLTYTKSGSAEKDFSGTVDAFLQGAEDASEGTAAASDYAVTSGTAADAAKEVAKRFLAALTAGEGSGGVRLRPRTECVRKTPLDTVYLVEFAEELVRGSNAQNAAVINETRMYVLVEGETVWYLCGTWVPFLPNETYQTRKLDQVNILFSEMQRLKKTAGGTEMDIGNAESSTGSSTESGDDRLPDDTPAMAEADGDTSICTVLDMRRTYYILWGDAGRLYLRPAWQFSYCFSHAAAEVLYQKIVCDAVTGSVALQEAHVDASA